MESPACSRIAGSGFARCSFSGSGDGGHETTANRGELARLVKGEDGYRLGTAPVHGGEATLGDRAGFERTVDGVGMISQVAVTGELKLLAVEIGPHVRRATDRDALSPEQSGGDHGASFLRRGPVFDLVVVPQSGTVPG